MIIDCHTHILPEDFARDRDHLCRVDRTFAELFSNPRARIASADELIASMDRWGIDRAVALGYGWTDPGIAQAGNDYLLAAARKSEGRIVPFCAVNPTWGRKALREVERCASAGARGIGELHPDSQDFDIADPVDMAPLMEVAAERNLVVLTHASEPVGHVYPGKGAVWPSKLVALASNFPKVNFIFAHWGGGLPFYMLMPELNRELTNAWFDSAASPFLYHHDVFSVASDAAGAKRVLFGSDYPLLEPGRVLAQVRLARLEAQVERAVLGANAAALLDL